MTKGSFMKCRACGKEITFIRTSSGKAMPVDMPGIPITIESTSDKTYVLNNGAVVKGRPCFAGRDTRIGYISHFATYPEAHKFRKR